MSVTLGGLGADHLARAAGAASLTRSCRALRRSLRYYVAKANEWRARMGAQRLVAKPPSGRAEHQGSAASGTACPRYLLKLWRSKARAARVEYRRWQVYHYHWWKWLPSKWQRIGACETGYGKRPGSWTWDSGTYISAFGIYRGSWYAFGGPHWPTAKELQANPKLGLPTPRQQYEVALAIYRRYGLSGWGCRGA